MQKGFTETFHKEVPFPGGLLRDHLYSIYLEDFPFMYYKIEAQVLQYNNI